ncbi:MAG: hypothetical protein Q8K78_03560 [Planctomycetaceae bacterium]|nr:hypothetical protein [Planctomycetaceae bacterium]
MARFTFRLQSLLNYRESRRDLVRQELARLLTKDAELLAQRQGFLDERAAVIAEMLALQQNAVLNVTQAASRRYHAGQLAIEAERIAQIRQILGQRIDQCRQQLIQADQSVKVLEQLHDHQQTEFLAQDELRQAKQREDAWQAGKLAQAVWQHREESTEFSSNE